MDAFGTTHIRRTIPRDVLERASHEVDRSLLQWSLRLSLRERLRAATRAGRMLERFRDQLLLPVLIALARERGTGGS